jgi:hypothetical protein
MKTTAGFDQRYNGQTAVDEASQLIVATGLSNGAALRGQRDAPAAARQADIILARRLLEALLLRRHGDRR